MIREQRLKPLASEMLLAELGRVLHYEKFVRAIVALGTSPENLVTQYRELVELIVPGEVSPDAVRDAQDVIVLSCAVAGKAEFIISGDKDLLVIGAYQNIAIVSADQFLSQLSENDFSS